MTTLDENLASYLELRRTLGTELREPGQALGHFLRFMDSQGAEFVTTDLAVRWATTPAQAQTATWARRLCAVRGFARWLSAADPRTEIPPVGLLPHHNERHEPYIFANDQIEQLMAEAARLRSRTGLHALTYTTLIGLLAATGMRPGEATALDVGDVDLCNGILSVRMTKFGKSRFVPVHTSARSALEAYAQHRDRICPVRDTAAFLVSERGIRLNGIAARRTFADLTRQIGLRPPKVGHRQGRGPRMLDLRHTFTTRRLIEWYRAGVDVERMVPRLSTYLGHSAVGHTYWYMQAVPELLQLAAQRLGERSQEGAS
jgi:site-specific recombinase XerD